MNLYIFGIGGTGSRVIKALTMLLASGVKLPENLSITPIIIDLDVNNGDTESTRNLLNQYEQIHAGAYESTTDALNDQAFFKVPVKPISQKKEGGFGEHKRNGFHMNFGAEQTTFFQYIKGANLDDIDLDFLKLLYNESKETNSGEELHLDLTLGFQGNPNIGSVVFGKITNTEEFKLFEQSFNEGDRIFVVGSIFGGTGSSGFPRLVQLIRNSKAKKVQDSILGGAVVMPYFNIAENNNGNEHKSDQSNGKTSNVNSALFNSKTKAALNYYEQELDGKMSAMYYIGDQANLSYQFQLGGKQQRNLAHIVELITATSIVRFANSNFSEQEKETKTKYYEFGIINDVAKLDVTDFHAITRSDFLKPLTQLALVAKFFLHDVEAGLVNREAFYSEIGLRGAFKESEFYNSFIQFLKNYWIWLEELENNRRGFAPFNLNEDYPLFLKSKDIQRSRNPINRLRRSILDELTKELFVLTSQKSLKVNRAYSAEQKAEIEKRRYQHFIRSINQAFEKVFDRFIDILPSR